MQKKHIKHRDYDWGYMRFQIGKQEDRLRIILEKKKYEFQTVGSVRYKKGSIKQEAHVPLENLRSWLLKRSRVGNLFPLLMNAELGRFLFKVFWW